MVTRYFNLFLNEGTASSLLIHSNQFENDEQWIFTLFDENGTQYVPIAAIVTGTKGDKNIIIRNCSIDGSGRVVMPVNDQLCTAPGISKFELVLGTGPHRTATFLVDFEPSPINQYGLLSEADLAAVYDAVEMAIDSQTVTVLRNRVENIIAGTPGDQELVDIRVGANGTTYQSAGTAVRTQVTALNTAIAAKAAASDLTAEVTARENADSDLNDAIKTISSATKNKFIAKVGTFYGVTFSYLPDGGLKITGTCTQTANIKNVLPEQYYGSYSLKCNSSQSFGSWELSLIIRNASETQINSLNLTGTDGEISSTTSAANKIAIADITIYNGVTYDATVYVQLEMQIPSTDFVSPFSALDRIARDSFETETEEIKNTIPFAPKLEYGKYINAYNQTSVYATAVCTDVFEVSEGETYTINSCAFANAEAYILMDENGTVTAHQNSPTETWTVYNVTIPTGVKFMRASSTKSEYFYVLSGEKRTGNIEELLKELDILKQNVFLNNKKWYACGDSFTHGDFTGVTPPIINNGKYKGQLAVYPYLIANRTNANVVNMAENGATIAESGNPNVYALSRDGNYNSIPSDADYVTIMIGINDSGLSIPLGTISDTVNTTFYGAWNTVLSWLRNNRPFTKVGIIISLSLHENYRSAEIAIAKKYGFPYLNLPEDETLPAFLWASRENIDSDIQDLINTQQEVSNSNFHPNANTHKLLSTVIQNWINSI